MNGKPPCTPALSTWPTRRNLVAASLAGLGLAPGPADAADGLPPPLPYLTPTPVPGTVPPPIPAGPPGLGAIAAHGGRVFGAAVQSQRFASEPGYAATTALECAMLMPDYETKLGTMQPSEGKFDFAAVDRLVAWARAHRMPVRGHGLIWHQDLPAWTIRALAQGPVRGRALMETHIGRVLTHTQGDIGEWDVVNEAVADPAGSDTAQLTPGELRDTPWLQALGTDYIATALRMAKERAPAIRVVLNEYGLEEGFPHHIEKRRRFLNLVRSLRRKNVPLDAVGLQGHLQMANPFAGPPFTAFCRLLRAEGVDLVVTEMDIREHWRIPDGIEARDRAVADRIHAFMDAAIDGGVKTFVTWGLSDKNSWLASEVHVKRTDGLQHRGLPLDDDGRRKPYWLAMADAFRRA